MLFALTMNSRVIILIDVHDAIYYFRNNLISWKYERTQQRILFHKTFLLGPIYCIQIWFSNDKMKMTFPILKIPRKNTT